MNEYYVYIMTNYAHTLYTGVTNNLERRVYEHKLKFIPGFTARYDLTTLVYYECAGDVSSAIAREKQIKGWLRRRKVALIESLNPEWRDLSLDWETLRYVYTERSECAQGGREGLSIIEKE